MAPRLACAAPTIVGTGFIPRFGSQVTEVALAPGGLRLFARCSAGRCVASRAARDSPFGAWGPTADLPDELEDPTFFTHLGQDRLIIARALTPFAPRRLELCTWPDLACAALPIADARGEITFDADGASVAVVGGRVLLAHNIGAGGEMMADIYLAEASDATDLSLGFITAGVAAINQASWKEDDPALSPDGLVLVFSATASQAAPDSDLWISQRASLSAPFSAPDQLASVNSSLAELDAYFGPLPPLGGRTRYELFLSSTRSGQAQVFRSECAR